MRRHIRPEPATEPPMGPEVEERLRFYTGQGVTESHHSHHNGSTVESRRFTIEPYWDGVHYIFNDPRLGIWEKPFVAGRPEIVDQMLRRAGLKSGQPLTVEFGDHDYVGTGCRFVLEWVRQESENQWYRCDGREMLCPALLRYFDGPPKHICCWISGRRPLSSTFQKIRR